MTKIYKITTSEVKAIQYLVEANSVEEAKNTFNYLDEAVEIRSKDIDRSIEAIEVHDGGRA
tara:strand:- start:117 stop:299 length:183 start_codon:yes stop_codon:yes gene_type:complete